MLTEFHQARGATLDPLLRIPQHYGAPTQEYQAAHEAAILVDRSDEGRIMLTEADRLAILHRISTNAVDALQSGEGCATVLITPIGRIIDRIVLHNVDDNTTLARTGSGRGAQVAAYLRKNVFFRDRMKVADQSEGFAQFALYGPQSGAVIETLLPGAGALALHHVAQGEFAGGPLYVVALDPPGVHAFGVIVPVEHGAALWDALLVQGEPLGLVPSGLSVYDMLRIEAGLPDARGEITEDYIPLEVGLWSDVSFTKGCYTGQEIIARMESRGKLAKTLVGVTLPGPFDVGSPWTVDGRKQGTLTSTAALPDGNWIGLGVARPELASVGQPLEIAQDQVAVVRLLPGKQQRD